MRTRYDKLIRDHVPEIMDAQEVRYEVGVLGDEAFRRALLTKLAEEAAEAGEAAGHEALVRELADLSEVLDAVMEHAGIGVEEVRSMQRARRAERGGFERRLVLRWTEP